MARRAPASTKSDLLQAAEECFAAHGLDATKIEDITARIGIAKGAFYSYFESKDACWKELVEGFLVRLREVVDDHGVGLSSRAPIPERVEIWLAHDLEVFEFCWENRTLLGMLGNGAGGIAYAHLLDEFARSASCNAEALVRSLIAEGVYQADVDPQVVASMLGGGYDRLARELIRKPKKPNLEAMLREAQRVFLHGLLTDSSRRELSRGPDRKVRKPSAKVSRVVALPARDAKLSSSPRNTQVTPRKKAR
jgi:AcrR family transcriptional regulator